MTTYPINNIPAIDAEIVQVVQTSFERATKQNPSFFEEFYTELLSKKKEYVQMFGSVDMVHQYARLYNGILKLIEFARDPKPETLHLVATIHKRTHVNVKPTHYLDWLDSLLAVLSRSDPEFDVTIADGWITVVMPGIDYMKSIY